MPTPEPRTAPPSRLRVVAVVATAIAAEGLYLWIPTPAAAEPFLDVLVPLTLSAVGVALIHGRSASIARELGVSGSPRLAQALLVAVVAALPLYAALTGTHGAHAVGAREVLRGALFPGLVEETLFRGLAFGQLRRRARLGFWAASVPAGLAFGAAHVFMALRAGEAATGVAGVVAMTAAGGLWFAWLFERWGTLWMPIAMHALMDLAWLVGSGGSTAVGDAPGEIGRAVTVVLAVALTLRHTRRREGGEAAGGARA